METGPKRFPVVSNVFILNRGNGGGGGKSTSCDVAALIKSDTMSISLLLISARGAAGVQMQQVGSLRPLE